MFTEKLDIQLIESLEQNGFTESTALQHLCIPKIKSGRDLACVADNETGKTTTIVISVLQKLKASLDDNPRAVIIVPNSESANKIKEEFVRLGEYTDLRIHTACEDGKLNDQKDQIYLGSDVVIGTAKRLNQVYSIYGLNLSVVKIFAIDDAERVIKSINYSQIDRLAESLPKAQKLVFCSDVNDWIARFADEFMNVQEFLEFEEDGEE
jgi:superfamily II DNA/RNA helicase